MIKKYKSQVYLTFILLVNSCTFIFLSKSMASTNPYGEEGFSFKDGFKKNSVPGANPKEVKQVQLEADQVQFSQDNNKANAKGNVVVNSGTTVLYADQLELQRSVGEAVASGHVYIDSPGMKVDAEEVQFNFNNSTGEFKNARIFNAPFQIKGNTVSKVSDTHTVMHNGFLTTCDFDEPHYRLGMKKMDYYQGDKVVAQGVTMFLGKMPIVYLSRYTQDLKNEPIFTIIPGYKKDFGAFALSTLRLKLSDNVKVTVHGDYRERLGMAEGVDVKYTTPGFGSGLLRTYYTHETEIASKHAWNQEDSNGNKKGPTIRHERYKIEWRHQWQIDRDTSAIWQYYKIHDYDLRNMGFIKRYFEREYRAGPDVNTYFLLTRNLPKGVVTFRIDASRVNKALQSTDRLPEIRYDLSGEKLGDTNFYLKSTDTFTNISAPYPDNHLKTMRMDVDNEISYPKKVGFLEFRPYVGQEHTYYSRTNDVNLNNVVRGQFKTGSDVTTHFYRVWNYSNRIMGVEINKLRHVITPTITYQYNHRPTISASHFNQFDVIDARGLINNVHFSLENKLQTKRNNKSVDLLRLILESDYSLIRSVHNPAFASIASKLEFNPADWLTFSSDGIYDNHKGHWDVYNFDAYIHPTDKWSFGLGKRYSRELNDQLTTEWLYKINPKWKFKISDRFLLDKGIVQEEDYIFTRDLHEWEMDLQYHHEKGSGHGFLIAFRLKAFPNMGLNLFSTTFHQPRAGAQDSIQTSSGS